jgi:flagellar FliL protein
MSDMNETEKPGGGFLTPKNMILFGLLILLLIGVGVVAWLLLQQRNNLAQAQGGQEVAAARSNTVSAQEVGPMVSIDPFIVNILDHETTRYLKAAITLEVDSPEAGSEAELRMPQLQDAILLLVGNKTFDELRDLQGKLQLRAELMEDLNKVMQKGQVRKIYFTDFVVQ